MQKRKLPLPLVLLLLAACKENENVPRLVEVQVMPHGVHAAAEVLDVSLA
jgi:hypothetical protein